MKSVVLTANTSWFLANFFLPSIREFLDNGTKVYVIAPKDEHSTRLIEAGASYIPINFRQSGGNPFKEAASIFQLTKLIKEIAPNCVFCFTPKMAMYSALACKALGIKVVCTVSGLGTIFTSRWTAKSMAGRILMHITHPMIDYHIFQNSDDHNQFLKLRLTSLKSSTCVKGIGVDINHFDYAPLTKTAHVKFLMLSRLLYSKGVEYYVEAARHTASQLAKLNIKPQFSLLGFIDSSHPDGIPEELILEWDKQGHINYLGHCSDVRPHIRGHEIIVLPSYYNEGMPQCLLEAAAIGRPVITTDNVGCRDAIDNGETGTLVAAKSISALSEAMVHYATSSTEKRIAIGKKAREKAEREFCHKIIAEIYLQQIPS